MSMTSESHGPRRTRPGHGLPDLLADDFGKPPAGAPCRPALPSSGRVGRGGVGGMKSHLTGRLKAMYERVSWRGIDTPGVLQDRVARVSLPL